jgi:3-oxoacyl-[acyl-carrier protein] reductase
MNRLSGRRVIVTGGAQGIGAAIVRTIAGEGAAVMVLDGCAEAAALLAEEVGGHAYVADLIDVRSTRDAMDRAIARLGGLDVLVNNAGVMRFCALLDQDSPDLCEVFDMGTRTMLITMQMAARAMVRFRTPADGCAGKLINVAGTGGTGGGHAHFAASQAAVTALTRAAAHQLGRHGITVNCLCPGYLLDDREAMGSGPSRLASWQALSRLGRLSRPQDVASVALFLASRDSDHLTGDTLNVSGGMALH